MITDWIDDEFKDFEFQPLRYLTYSLLSFVKSFQTLFHSKHQKERKEKEL